MTYFFRGPKALLLMIALFAALSVACGAETSQDSQDRTTVSNQQDVYANTQQVPFYDWSLERHVVIQLYNLRNEAQNTWTVWGPQGSEKLIDSCPSVGYPIPYDTSLTNPLKPAYSYRDSGVIEQPEPNGLYPSKNSVATWVLCIDDVTGEVMPVFVEHVVMTYPYPVEVVDYQLVRLEGGAPSITIDVTRPENVAPVASPTP